ncbi:MAG TPA: hypothetical protein VNZ22_01345, partial [Bacillota bacterium]|nr:hypothetical protein [Bacillota bacterium]
MKPSLRHGSLAGLLLVFVLAGCSAKHFRKSADREVYGIIQSKAPLVQNMDSNFTIELTNMVLVGRLPISTNVPEALGPDGQRERGARIVRLEDALAIGVKCSRKYQFEKEKLYLSALALTLARHQFTPIFSAQGNVRYEVDKVVDDSNPNVSDHLVEEQKIRSQGDFVRVDWLLGSVGKITTAVTADFLRFVSGDRGFVTSTSVGATFTRPLLQNAGFKREREALTQAERDLLYDLRNFTQFRKDFSVLIATTYYGVLGRRDTVRNSF